MESKRRSSDVSKCSEDCFPCMLWLRSVGVWLWGLDHPFFGALLGYRCDSAVWLRLAPHSLPFASPSQVQEWQVCPPCLVPRGQASPSLGPSLLLWVPSKPLFCYYFAGLGVTQSWHRKSNPMFIYLFSFSVQIPVHTKCSRCWEAHSTVLGNIPLHSDFWVRQPRDLEQVN